MITCIYPNDKKSQKRIIKNIHAGLGSSAQFVSIDYFKNYGKLPPGTKTVVFAGIIRGFGNLYRYCLDHDVDFYYVDHAYFYSGYNEANEWVRITHRDFNQNTIKEVPADRRAQYFRDIQILPWQRTKGGHILVIPPTPAVINLFDCTKWLDAVQDKIKQKTNLPIKVREKEEKIIVDQDGNVTDRIKINYNTTLQEDIANADCVVTFNSSVAVQAALSGKPVITTNMSAAYPISNSFSNIGEYQYFDREPWLNSLCYSQFNTRELISSEAFDILKKYG